MNATHEQWRPVVGFEGSYEVSNHGRVRSLPRYVNSKYCQRRIPGKILTPFAKTYGHLAVHLSAGKRRVNRHIHRLVMEAFVGPCPDGMECCHNNGDASDNRLTNLRWDTSASNTADVTAHGTFRPRNPTHCPRGHSRIAGERQCKQCVSLVMKARYRGEPIPPWTHCCYGHFRSPENVLVHGDGKTRCRACQVRRERRATQWNQGFPFDTAVRLQ